MPNIIDDKLNEVANKIGSVIYALWYWVPYEKDTFYRSVLKNQIETLQQVYELINGSRYILPDEYLTEK